MGRGSGAGRDRLRFSGNGTPQKSKQKLSVVAIKRGVVSARRPIEDPESIEILGRAKSRIIGRYSDFPTKAGRFYDEASLAVTIIGYSRFADRHKKSGPPTKDIIDVVDSSHKFIEARLGRIGLYGRPGSEKKLGFELHSPDLYQEERDIRDMYDNIGFKLNRDCNARNRSLKLHVTIAELWSDHKEKFRTQDRLERLNEIADVAGRLILLAPIDLTNQPTTQIVDRI